MPLKPIKTPFNHHFPMVFLWFSYGFPMVSLPHLPFHAASDQRVVAEGVAPHRRLRHGLEAQQRLRPLRPPAVANDGAGEVGHGEAPWRGGKVRSFQKMWLEKKKIMDTYGYQLRILEHIWGWVKTLVPSEPQNSW